MFYSDRSKDSLEELHQKFIVTLIVRATGNVPVISKRFYPLTFINELEFLYC